MSSGYPARRKPLVNNTELIWRLLAVVIFSILFSLPIPDMTGSLPGLLIYIVGVGAIEFLMIWRIWKLLKGKRVLDRGSATTTAKIFHRRVVKESGCLMLLVGLLPIGRTDYVVTFEFDAAQAASASGIMRLEARVEKDLYERLIPPTTIQVRYAIADPRVVLLEGE